MINIINTIVTLINSKVNIIVISILITIITGLFISNKMYYEKYNKEKHLSSQLSNSVNNLNQQIKHISIKLNDSTSILANEIEVLYLKSENYKKLQVEETKIVEKLKLKIRDLNSQSNIITKITDTVFVPTIQKDTISLVKYNDNFVNIECEIGKIKSKITYSYTDSLIIYDYRKRKSWLFGLFKTESKSNKLVVISKNPKSKITNIQMIKIIQ